MILKTLVENTSISPDYKHKHGVSFFIQTNKHRILFDLGQNGLFLENARKMGVDIQSIGTVIISHGHIDHGGALKLFLQNNPSAKIYIRENAFNKHYTKVFGFKVNVGIDNSLKNHPQVVLTGNRTILDDGLTLFSDIDTKDFYSVSNHSLYVEEEGCCHLDDFSHEQNLLISEGENKILVAGCSHAGIVNIKEKAEQIVGDKLSHIIAGFHLYNPVSRKTESDILVKSIAKRLDDKVTQYYTCHCTGKRAFASLKEILSDKITYLSVGSTLEI